MSKKSDVCRTRSFLADIRHKSELLRLTTSYNWDASPVGPIKFWPQSLKNAVSLILQSGMPMYLAWGKDFTQFYNDGYLTFLGTTKHPRALGNSAKETWGEIWEFLNPLWESVLATGQPVCSNDLKLMLERDGQLVECYFSYSCSALCDDEGNIAGIFSAATETTSEVKLKQQLILAREESEIERAKLHGFFMQAPMPICIFEGPSHQFVLTNPSHEKFSVRKIENGKTPLEVFSAEEASAFVSLLDQVYKTGVPYVGTHPVFLPDENGVIVQHWINIGYHPYRNNEGSIHGVMAVVQDLTTEIRARKDAEKSERKLQVALERGRMGTWQIDLKTGHASFCDETKKLFLIDSQEGSLTELIRNMVHPEDVEGLNQALSDAVGVRGPFFHEYRINRRDGRSRWCVGQGDVVWDTDGSPRFYSGTVQDITERVEAKIELEKAVLEAKMANQTKSAFLANMSHEIRTPLGAILGFTDILKDRNLDYKARRQYLDIISCSGKALTKIIDDILDLTKIEAGKLEIERIEFDVMALLSETAILFQHDVASKNIELKSTVHPSMPRLINSDPTRIRQILINLIGNAVKFTSKGSIEVFAEPKFKNGTLVAVDFIVNDTGIGMTPQQIEKLFAPFAQADNSTTRKFGGTGLGLDLSRRLARALGGDINIQETEARKGCTFLATISACAVDLNSRAFLTENSRVSPLHDHDISRVLLVEDSVDNQLLVKLLLAKAGISVDVANNGAEGVEMAGKNDYDVVLMDMQMPVLDGYAATSQLRHDGYDKPIIALTAHAMAEDRSRILELGCNAYLTKPIDARLLIETLGRVKTVTH